MRLGTSILFGAIAGLSLAAFFFWFIGPVNAGTLPDPKLTPGTSNLIVTQASIKSTICKSGWTKTIRPPASYTNALKKKQLADPRYGDTDKNPRDYEEDHFIPLEIGGAPRDPKNLWPMAYAGKWGARVKDKIETRLRTEVCAGISLFPKLNLKSEQTGRKPTFTTSDNQDE